MNVAKVIGVSGEIASGKSELAKRFSNKMGWKYTSFGDYIRNEAKKRGIPETRINLQKIGTELVTGDLEDFCKKVLNQVNWVQGEPLIIDGIRHTEVQLMIKQLVAPSPFILVYLDVSEEERQRRLLNKEGTYDKTQYEQIEKDSTEIQVKKFLPQTADFLLNGNRPTEVLLEELQDILENLPEIEETFSNPNESEDNNFQIGANSAFDPNQIRIDNKLLSVDFLLEKIIINSVDLFPNYQRKHVWTVINQSRLIESILLRIPLPTIYVDDNWLVYDGIQRLNAIYEFVVLQNFTLKGLEVLLEFENKSFNDLPRNIQRRIRETTIHVALIDSKIPTEIKFKVFRRINTGGLPLSSQEIRQILYHGPATELLLKLVNSEEFKGATSNRLRSERMQDRAYILWFLAFALKSYKEYEHSDFEEFLNQTMSKLNTMTEKEREDLANKFINSMRLSRLLFGAFAFQKEGTMLYNRPQFNPALFEAWSVKLCNLKPEEIDLIIKAKDKLNLLYLDLLNKPEFNQAISHNIHSAKNINFRFQEIDNLINEVLNDSVN